MDRIRRRGKRPEGRAAVARIGGAVLMVAFFAGCASVAKDWSDEDKRQAVAARAAARWALIIQGKAGAAYDEYMSKGSRAVISRGEFVAKMQVSTFRTAKVDKVECAVESCKATVKITYDYKIHKQVPNTMRETWIIEDGQVHYVWLL